MATDYPELKNSFGMNGISSEDLPVYIRIFSIALESEFHRFWSDIRFQGVLSRALSLFIAHSPRWCDYPQFSNSKNTQELWKSTFSKALSCFERLTYCEFTTTNNQIFALTEEEHENALVHSRLFSPMNILNFIAAFEWYDKVVVQQILRRVLLCNRSIFYEFSMKVPILLTQIMEKTTDQIARFAPKHKDLYLSGYSKKLIEAIVNGKESFQSVTQLHEIQKDELLACIKLSLESSGLLSSCINVLPSFGVSSLVFSSLENLNRHPTLLLAAIEHWQVTFLYMSSQKPLKNEVALFNGRAAIVASSKALFAVLEAWLPANNDFHLSGALLRQINAEYREAVAGGSTVKEMSDISCIGVMKALSVDIPAEFNENWRLRTFAEILQNKIICFAGPNPESTHAVNLRTIGLLGGMREILQKWRDSCELGASVGGPVLKLEGFILPADSVTTGSSYTSNKSVSNKRGNQQSNINNQKSDTAANINTNKTDKIRITEDNLMNINMLAEIASCSTGFACLVLDHFNWNMDTALDKIFDSESLPVSIAVSSRTIPLASVALLPGAADDSHENGKLLAAEQKMRKELANQALNMMDADARQKKSKNIQIQMELLNAAADREHAEHYQINETEEIDTGANQYSLRSRPQVVCSARLDEADRMSVDSDDFANRVMNRRTTSKLSSETISSTTKKHTNTSNSKKNDFKPNRWADAADNDDVFEGSYYHLRHQKVRKNVTGKAGGLSVGIENVRDPYNEWYDEEAALKARERAAGLSDAIDIEEADNRQQQGNNAVKNSKSIQSKNKIAYDGQHQPNQNQEVERSANQKQSNKQNVKPQGVNTADKSNNKKYNNSNEQNAQQQQKGPQEGNREPENARQRARKEKHLTDRRQRGADKKAGIL